MSQNNGTRSLSKLEWFGLISGIIGLVADIYSISQIFASKGALSGPPQVSSGVSPQVWIVVLLCIIYTNFVFAFYSRRLFFLRHIRIGGPISKETYDRIEAGAKWLTRILTTTLISAYAIVGSLTLIDAEAIRRAAIGNDSWMRTPADRLMMVFLGALPIGVLSSWMIIDFLNAAARSLYAAFDPEYKVGDRRYDD